jgi:hypothetical protein
MQQRLSTKDIVHNRIGFGEPQPSTDPDLACLTPASPVRSSGEFAGLQQTFYFAGIGTSHVAALDVCAIT